MEMMRIFMKEIIELVNRRRQINSTLWIVGLLHVIIMIVHSSHVDQVIQQGKVAMLRTLFLKIYLHIYSLLMLSIIIVSLCISNEHMKVSQNSYCEV